MRETRLEVLVDVEEGGGSRLGGQVEEMHGDGQRDLVRQTAHYGTLKGVNKTPKGGHHLVQMHDELFLAAVEEGLAVPLTDYETVVDDSFSLEVYGVWGRGVEAVSLECDYSVIDISLFPPRSHPLL